FFPGGVITSINFICSSIERFKGCSQFCVFNNEGKCSPTGY
ncbi:unnamed protein product, partial [Allacma fusca]